MTGKRWLNLCTVAQLLLLSCCVVSVRATSPPHPHTPHTPHHRPSSARQAPSTFSVFVASSPCLIAGVTQTWVSHHRNVSAFYCLNSIPLSNQCKPVYRTRRDKALGHCFLSLRYLVCPQWDLFSLVIVFPGDICSQAYCHMYWGCRKSGCRGCLNLFKGNATSSLTLSANILIPYSR